MRSCVYYKCKNRLLKFFRNTLLNLSVSAIQELSVQYENDIKQLKDTLYRIGWNMRGALSYDDLFYKISVDDRDVLSKIIKDNIETTNKTGLPLI